MINEILRVLLDLCNKTIRCELKKVSRVVKRRAYCDVINVEVSSYVHTN